MAEELEPDDTYSPFQIKPFYESRNESFFKEENEGDLDSLSETLRQPQVLQN